jgi:hypothetical protein
MVTSGEATFASLTVREVAVATGHLPRSHRAYPSRVRRRGATDTNGIATAPVLTVGPIEVSGDGGGDGSAPGPRWA